LDALRSKFLHQEIKTVFLPNTFLFQELQQRKNESLKRLERAVLNFSTKCVCQTIYYKESCEYNKTRYTRTLEHTFRKKRYTRTNTHIEEEKTHTHSHKVDTNTMTQDGKLLLSIIYEHHH
jgi:hypothetical protein